MSMDQKKLTIITLLVVVAGAVGINEMLIRKENKEQNREVASFGERFVPEQIKWEQELARNVSREAHGAWPRGAFQPSLFSTI